MSGSQDSPIRQGTEGRDVIVTKTKEGSQKERG